MESKKNFFAVETDIWETEANQKPMIKETLVVNPKVIVPDKGESYNPSHADYLEKLKKVVSEEKPQEVSEAKRNKKIEKRNQKRQKLNE